MYIDSNKNLNNNIIFVVDIVHKVVNYTQTALNLSLGFISSIYNIIQKIGP